MDYDLMLFYKSNIIALSGTKGAHVDVAALPEFLGDNLPERLMKYLAYRKSGLALFDSSQDGQQSINTYFGGFDDTVSGQAMQAIQLAIQMIEETASSITGVFRERLGGIQQRDAVANVEAGMQQSFIITKQYYQVMDTLVSEMLTDALNLARKVYKKGLTGQLILGDKKEIFTLMPEHYSQTDYDVHLADSTELMKEQEVIKQLAMQLAQNNQVDPEILSVVMCSKSLTEMKEAVRKSIKEKKIENNQLAQLQQQLQEAQQQVEQMQKQLQESTKKLATLNERKLQIEEQDNAARQQIDWYKVKADAEYKQGELDLIKKRNEIEFAQIIADDGKQNDEVLDRKY